MDKVLASKIILFTGTFKRKVINLILNLFKKQKKSIYSPKMFFNLTAGLPDGIYFNIFQTKNPDWGKF
jgi:hypothetical protein